MKFRELLPFLTSRAPLLKIKGRGYASCVRSSMICGSETRSLLFDVGLKFERAEMQMIRWMCGISMKDRRNNNTWCSPRIHPRPLLLIIYMNDFSRSSDLLFSILFADDTSVFIEGTNFENIPKILNTELESQYVAQSEQTNYKH